MASVMLCLSVQPGTSVMGWAADAHRPGDSMLIGVEDRSAYCIDSFELLGEAGGIMGGVNEEYTCVLPSTRLSGEECAILFWATLSMLADKADGTVCRTALEKINGQAGSAGLMPITRHVTEHDLKLILHLKSVRSQYPWLDCAVANAKEYMKLAGLSGSAGAATAGGKEIPSILQGHTGPAEALMVDGSSFTIPFDASGADRDFIRTVPLQFSLTGGEPWSAVPPGGWTCLKTDTSIQFSNHGSQPPKLVVRFDPTGTEYQRGSGYTSPQELYNRAMQLWVCTRCSGLHIYHSQKEMPLEAHQRLVNLQIEAPAEQYYAVLAGGPEVGAAGGGAIAFQIYRHAEEMQSSYNLQLYKYDHETGKPLEHTAFKLYERFDDQGQIDREQDGPAHIYEGGAPYQSSHKDSPVVWDDFKFVTGMVTDEEGHSEKTVNHGYHYDKTFCDGHPAPRFVSVPEEEEDEETGEILNEDEIEAARAENRHLAQTWLDCYGACEVQASGEFVGVHFHWLMGAVDMGEIQSTRSSGGSPGETPDGGKKVSASPDEAYEESGCRTDCQETYERFISLRYSYALVESSARPGYILHGLHRDDLPIEVITTDASEHGANAVFAGEYGDEITVNDRVAANVDGEAQAEGEGAEATGWKHRIPQNLAGNPAGIIRLQQDILPYHQDPLRFLMPVEPEEENEGGYESGEAERATASDAKEVHMTASDAKEPHATASNAEENRIEIDDAVEEAEENRIEIDDTVEDEEAALTDMDELLTDDVSGDRWSFTATPANLAAATPSNVSSRMQVQFTQPSEGRKEAAGKGTFDAAETSLESSSALFSNAYQSALNGSSFCTPVEPGPADRYSHCGNQDGEGDAWRIYDHRTEGELHVNKRDMELQAEEADGYDSYGDTQGDGTLEGAVYGLFAATDLIHPDRKTGVVYRANNLVAVATTDKNGDASFMANTEAPGMFYDYGKGRITETADGWAASAPKNLYTVAKSWDDYTEDGQHVRTYPDYEAENGNCWIGRPLLMGSYYVKELTRSEGYELSIGNRDHKLTNYGQNCDMALPEGTGYVNITKRLYGEGQIAPDATGAYGDPDINELFFSAQSRGTEAEGFDIVLYNLPSDAKVYRLDTGTGQKEVEIGTGVYEKTALTNPDGSLQYVVAERDGQYPKYQEDGSLMTEEISVNYEARLIPVMERCPLDEGKTLAAMEAAEESADQETVAAMLAEDFDLAAGKFLKGKVERALRASGKHTPKQTGEKGPVYSGITQGIFDADAPITLLELPKTDADGIPWKTGDVLLSVLDFYNTNSFYSFGGIHELQETADAYLVTLYTGCMGNPDNYMVQGSDPESDSVIYHRIFRRMEGEHEDSRCQYAAYSNNPEQGAFGTYENYEEWSIGGELFASATLITDAVVEADGTLASRTIRRNVYYQAGETPCDAGGHPIPAYEYREQTTKVTRQMEESRWTELETVKKDGVLVVPVKSTYTDSYGGNHQDTALQSYQFRVVLPEREMTLTGQDLTDLADNSGWSAGQTMGSGAYYLHVKHARVQAFLDYENLALVGDSSFVKQAELVYPGQQHIWQDGAEVPGTNTRTNPIAVQERPLKQQVKVTKTIDEKSYNNTSSYAKVHEDWWTKLFGGFTGESDRTGPVAKKLDNFRFKIYLKSNLERLYRDPDGAVLWQDRKGNTIDILAANAAYPALAGKIYTKVPHRDAPLYRNSLDAVIANTELYSHADGFLQESQNPGYTAILETEERLVEDGVGVRLVKAYNYDKFMDAIAVANQDKWDEAAPTYTSWQPMGNEANRIPETLENTKASDRVRQFAIDWYLDDEVAKLVRPAGEQSEAEEAAKKSEALDGSVAYTDELYDRALNCAITKTENYLKPFFAYDLDEIYAISWDSEKNGGRDQDDTTLSADCLYEKESADSDSGDGYYYGCSAYLPYGTYVVAEQQPRYHELEDFKNRHYQIDRPREVILPTVYAEEAGAQASPEVFSERYRYDADLEPSELERRYQIRFKEESHVIQAHNHSGDYEIYKYGLEIDRVTNGAPVMPKEGEYFALTQSEYRPYKNHYNEADDRNADEVTYYLSEGQSGRGGIARSYRYSSVSEQAGFSDDVPYQGGTVTEENEAGIWYRDQVRTMQGVQTACDGVYAAMLVPYSCLADSEPDGNGGNDDAGYSDVKFRNRFYTAKLRIEKLDAETHENILHEGALFNLYAAKRDDRQDGGGGVLFYTKPTVISGTREFLESMGATDIRPMARRISFMDRITGKHYGPGNLCTGMVPEGTPVCEEAEQIVLGDRFGTQTVAFKTCSTVRDGRMMTADSDPADPVLAYENQTVGYLETPQPLGAGCYVLCERKAPAGYARSRPVALEVYSDKVAYYKEGNRDNRVLAALYEYEADEPTANGNKPQDIVRVARVNVENAPVRLQVEKIKESSAGHAGTTADKTVTYKVSGRMDGKLVDIGNNPDYVYAYRHGDYQGYAWKKGTLEYLLSRKAAGEQVELVYEGSLFAGYGYVTRTLETADDENPYVAGAVMTLFDALELKASGDREDHAYEGLVIERSSTGNVSRMYVKEGYAGEKTEFVREKDEDGKEITVRYQAGVDRHQNPVYADGHVWSGVTVQRGDTDILYYDLDDLEVTATEWVDGRNILYGYDRNHRKVPIAQIESDKANFTRTDTEHSIYAFRGGVPYLEFTGGDFTRISYNRKDKIITTGPDTSVYHLDRQGNRDALVDPHTGMAYVTETGTSPSGNPAEKVLVWAVNLHRDEFGNVIARDKITTSRIATAGEAGGDGEEEKGYITGSWQMSDQQEFSHHETSLNRNQYGQNLNGEVLTDENNGRFAKELNPVYDEHGLAVYYQNSGLTYEKGTDLYDRNGDFVRHQDSDELEAYNQAAYSIVSRENLHDGPENQENPERGKLYHRQGECYILENTWMTSDRTPNDPFRNQMTAGQPDVLKRVPAGTYIMEELKAPDGYQKGMPVGICVLETAALQQAQMIDQTTKAEFAKVDGARTLGQQTGSGSYGYAMVPGAELALFEAERVYTSDTTRYPKGYYLKKTGTRPLIYHATDSRTGSIQSLTARWTTGNVPIYAEGIPEGSYLLEELTTPAGFITSEPVEVEITSSSEVQTFVMYDDHTKVEVEKYTLEGTKPILVNGAGFTLYPAVLDESGSVVYTDGKPSYDAECQVDAWVTKDAEYYRNFISEFERMYREYGCQSGTSISWETDGTDRSAALLTVKASEADTSYPTSAVLMFVTDQGEQIRITVSGEQQKRLGRDFTCEYQFDYQKLDKINDYAASWLTLEGMHRMDYLPVGGKYVLVETAVPAGYAKAEDTVIQIGDTADVQRYRIENQEGRMLISKVADHRNGAASGELAGAHLGLYCAAEDGSFVQDQAHLVTDWITGGDGRYTEEDAINHRIPEGYQAGDLRLHQIRRLDSGIYWLAELASPDYYMKMKPVRIVYDQRQEIRIVRAVNEPVTGSLTVKKADSEGSLLSGVTYELSAFRPSDLRNPVFRRQISDMAGIVRAEGLPVGEQSADGTIVPYAYRLRELTPPEGYAASTEVFRWQFSPNHAGQTPVSYEYGEQALQELTVTNQKTRIAVSKKDFELPESGGLIHGAELAVYEVTGRNERDELIYDESHPVAVWTTSMAEPEHWIEGMIAGHSYLLKEVQAPAGYHQMKPILFAISSDGRRITEISDRLNTITVHSVSGTDPDGQTDAIQSVTIHGRYAVKTCYEMTDQEGNLAASWIGAGTEHVIDRQAAESQGLAEGKIYTITEYTCYSDGTIAKTGRRTQMLRFDETGQFQIPVRTASAVTLSLEHSDGTAIDSFQPTEQIPTVHIRNNVSPENPKITMRNRDGQTGDVLDAQKAVFAEVSYMNPDHLAADMELTVRPAAGMTILDPGSGKIAGNHLVFCLEQVQPLASGVVSFTAVITGAGEENPGSGENTGLEENSGSEEKSGSNEHRDSAAITVTMKWNRSTTVTTKEVPILQPNRLTVFHELTGSGRKLYAEEESRFTVRLYRENGEELKGSYDYSGSRSGRMRSGDTITLAGNEFITIDPGLYRNVRYRVERQEDGTEYTSRYAEGIAGERTGAGAVFTRCVADTKDRIIFRRGDSYVLREETAYSDGKVLDSNKLGIRLDNQASVNEIIAADRQTKVVVSKTGITGREELPGNEMCIRTSEGEVLASWISGQEPYEIEGILEAGNTYILEEVCPKQGYSYGEAIEFTIDEEGVTEQVMMQNDMTRLLVRKVDAGTGKPLTGAVFQILNQEGAVLDRWTSDGSDHEVTGILTAGESYILREEQAPKGYEPGENLEFTVPEGQEILHLTVKNQRKERPNRPDEPEESNKPDKPKQPELPHQPKKIGTISAVYQPNGAGTGSVVEDTGRGWWRYLPYMGDRSKRIPLMVIFLSAALGLSTLVLPKRFRKRRKPPFRP